MVRPVGVRRAAARRLVATVLPEEAQRLGVEGDQTARRWFLASVHTAPPAIGTRPSSTRSVHVRRRVVPLSASSSLRRRPYRTPSRNPTAHRCSAATRGSGATSSSLHASASRSTFRLRDLTRHRNPGRRTPATGPRRRHRRTRPGARCGRSGCCAGQLASAGRRRATGDVVAVKPVETDGAEARLDVGGPRVLLPRLDRHVVARGDAAPHEPAHGAALGRPALRYADRAAARRPAGTGTCRAVAAGASRSRCRSRRCARPTSTAACEPSPRPWTSTPCATSSPR